RSPPVARHCEHVDAARRVTADKKIKQLRIKAVGVLDDLLDVESWLDVEIVADMAVLQIEIQQANPPAARLLGAFDLHGGFDRKRGVADSAGARHEYHDGRSNLFIAGGSHFLSAGARNDVENFLRSAFHRYPVSPSAAHQSLIVASRDLPADKNEEDTAMFPLRDVRHALE